MKLKIIYAILILTQVKCELCSFSPIFDFQMDVLKINVTDLKPSIINATFYTDDIMECTYRCDGTYHLSIYYLMTEKRCHCYIDIHRSAVGVVNSDLLYGFFNSFAQIPSGGPSIQTIPLKFDCLDLHHFGIQDDGVYIINPSGTQSVESWCDMSDGGWTVFQRRMNGNVDFYETWTEYQDGFGEKNEEYWLGLDYIYVLTRDHSRLNIYLGRFGNSTPANCTSEYSRVVVTDEQDKYRIIVYGHSGTCPNILASGHSNTVTNNSAFTTWDSDNDNATGGYNCASAWTGAWWFNDCFHTHLNGQYLGADNPYSGYGILVAEFTGYYESLETTVMKVRRN